MMDLKSINDELMAAAAGSETEAGFSGPALRALPDLVKDGPAAELVEDDDQPETSQGMRVFYDGSRFMMDTGRDFVPMDRRSFKAHLNQGFTENPEAEICRVQVENFVRYAGPIAGHRRGPIRSGDSLLLVTSGPTIIKAKVGPFPTIKAFLRSLLGEGEHGKRQLAAIMGWLHIARKALLAGKRRPGQALVLAGPCWSYRVRENGPHQAHHHALPWRPHRLAIPVSHRENRLQWRPDRGRGSGDRR